MTFDDWYETYERDGGELMLFNSLDMEAAYKAGYAEAIEAPIQHIIDQGTLRSFDHVYHITDTDIKELRALKEKV